MNAARAHSGRSPAIDDAAARWHDAARAAFIEAYLARVRAGGGTFLPADAPSFHTMLDFYLLEKCVYEVHYEIDNRPDWVAIPAAGLAQLLEEPADAR
jgi:maltose alpha-D-glucosyltransferase/alpha-amylase